MDRLTHFYLELVTDASKMNAFNLSADTRRAMLEQAGIENIDAILSMDKESLRQMLAKQLIEQSGDWQGLDNTSGNEDNKNNIGRMGRIETH